MRTRLAVVVLVAVAGCSSSGADELAGPTVSAAPPASSATPVTTSAAKPTASATAATPRAVPTKSKSPTPRPSTDSPTVVRDGDSGTTIHVRVGQRVRVRLEQDTWDPPTSSDEAVLTRRTSTGGYPTDTPADAVFEALKPGTADLAAQTDAACFHTEPRCLMPTRLWQVHVVVS